MLSRWIKEDENKDGQAFRGNGKLTPDQEKIRKLKAQVKRLEMEREILTLLPGEPRPTSRAKSHEIAVDHRTPTGVPHHHDVSGVARLDLGLLRCAGSTAEQAGPTP